MEAGIADAEVEPYLTGWYEGDVWARLPPEATSFILAFDSGGPVEPFNFEIYLIRYDT